MVEDSNHAALRRMLGDVIAVLGETNTHTTLHDAFTALGMPPAEEGSKRERVESSFSQVPDTDLLRLAERFLQTQSVDASTRNRLQDVLWAEASPPEIPIRSRRELARAIDVSALVQHAARFMAMLDRFWILDDDPLAGWLSAPSTTSRRARIERHVIRNPDWSTEDLFEALGAFEAGDARFARFIEAAVAAEVLLDEPAQRLLVDMMNGHLRKAAIEFRETGTDGGYPRFTLVSTRLAHTRRPRNVIFASPTKPDIRFLSAVDNDIELVSGDALVYDQAVTDDGIRWCDLQNWWQEKEQIPDEARAKSSLYTRLRSSLPGNSPGQRNLFDCYHRIFGPAVYDLPALLPEVWLHWDPKTVKERGAQALLRFRMDFLLLLPHGQRIVLEVDGSQHYTRDHGRTPDTSKYAEMMAGDRDLKLRGYEVFRFGHDELRDETAAHALLEQFLPELFRRYRVVT